MNKKISALFTTYNRSKYLHKALDGLLEQSFPKEQFEVIIIDDGSTDDTFQICDSFKDKLDLTYLFHKNSGISLSKNRALKLATGEIVIFMDDDDVPDHRLLEEHWISHQKNAAENIAILGHTNIDQKIAKNPLMHFVTQVGYQLFCYPKIEENVLLDYTYFWGGRSSCKLSFLVQNNSYFNKIFTFGCEDIELGYRLSKYDLKVIYNKKAISTMIRMISLRDFCRRTENQGYSNWIFSRIHQEEEISSWCFVNNLENEWNRIKNLFDHYKKSAEDLDELINIRMKNGMNIPDNLLDTLHKAYWLTIDSHRLRGSYKASLKVKI